MAKPEYQLLQIDLSTGPFTNKVLIGKGQQYNAVAVRNFPAGTVASLSFAENADGVPLAPGDSFFPITGKDENGCDVPADEGLFLTTPTVQAGILSILVSFGGQLALQAGA